MKLIERVISSEALGGRRKFWMEPAEGTPKALCLFLDGEFYLEGMRLGKMIKSLRAEGVLNDRRCVFVSHGGMAARNEDFTCNPRYSRFLIKELIPLVSAGQKPIRGGHVIVGLSLGGLAAAWAACRFPHVFPRLISQSPSAWWKDEWLGRHLGQASLRKSRMWVSVGAEETDTDVLHPPSALYQAASQLDSSRRLGLALKKRRAKVRMSVFDGGHEMKCWRKELPGALKWVTAGSRAGDPCL